MTEIVLLLLALLPLGRWLPWLTPKLNLVAALWLAIAMMSALPQVLRQGLDVTLERVTTSDDMVVFEFHDRGLLNRAVNRIIHVENRKLIAYTGNYDRFEQLRREQLERQAAQHAKQQAERRHIQSFVDRFRYKASKAKQAQAKLTQIERLDVEDRLLVQQRLAERPRQDRPIAVGAHGRHHRPPGAGV